MPIITLIFGCKHQTGDFIYKEEILGWKESGVIDRLHLAFSRDGDKVLPHSFRKCTCRTCWRERRKN
jgi:hypothetical protein